MSLFSRLGGLAVAVGLAFTPGHALALTQTYSIGGASVTVDNSSTYLTGPGSGVSLGNSSSGATLTSGGANSPFTNAAAQYASIAASTISTSAFVTYGSISADIFSFTWGNVRNNATIDFYSGVNTTGTLLHRISGGALLAAMGTTFGTNPDVFVKIDVPGSLAIKSVKMYTAFSNDPDATQAFNFGNLSYIPRAVPGPIAGAGLPMVLGMLGWSVFRRRRAAPASVAAA